MRKLLVLAFVLSLPVFAWNPYETCKTEKGDFQIKLDYQQKNIVEIRFKKAFSDELVLVPQDNIYKAELSNKKLVHNSVEITCPIYRADDSIEQGLYDISKITTFDVSLNFVAPGVLRNKVISMNSKLTCHYFESIQHMSCEKECPNQCRAN